MSHACDGRPDVNIDDLTGIVFSRLSSLGDCLIQLQATLGLIEAVKTHDSWNPAA